MGQKQDPDLHQALWHIHDECALALAHFCWKTSPNHQGYGAFLMSVWILFYPTSVVVCEDPLVLCFLALFDFEGFLRSASIPADFGVLRFFSFSQLFSGNGRY